MMRHRIILPIAFALVMGAGLLSGFPSSARAEGVDCQAILNVLSCGAACGVTDPAQAAKLASAYKDNCAGAATTTPPAAIAATPSAPATPTIPFPTDDCSANFSHSQIWLFSFRPVTCTNRQWEVARRVNGDRAECGALDPSGRLLIVSTSSGDEFAMFVNLEHDGWITSADQFGDVTIGIGNTQPYHALSQVDVSVSPPLRYGFLWRLKPENVNALKSGSSVTISIAGVPWAISLAGSGDAITAAQQCATWKGGENLSSGSVPQEPKGAIRSGL